MSDKQGLYGKKEISKILEKASQIQAQKDLYGSQDGLTEEELVQLAEEVGIDRDSLMEAISTYDKPELEQPFNWIKGTTRIQNISVVNGEFTEDQWEEIVQEIRRITGGIGKIGKVGKSYEWEQRRRDIGYKHFSFTPEKGKTRIQMVSSWSGLRIISQIIGFMVPFTVTAIALDGTNITEFPALLAAASAGLFLGIPLTRFYLKSFYERQKKQLNRLVSAISKKISAISDTGSIAIESEDVYRGSDRQGTPEGRENTT